MLFLENDIFVICYPKYNMLLLYIDSDCNIWSIQKQSGGLTTLKVAEVGFKCSCNSRESLDRPTKYTCPMFNGAQFVHGHCQVLVSVLSSGRLCKGAQNNVFVQLALFAILSEFTRSVLELRLS